jgi:hypothetical protein
VPYAQALSKLPSYLEQLEMESNGKSVRLDGSPVDQPTSPVVWGTAGTNGQHAYFQMLHQGTALVPLDLIGFVRAQPARDLGRTRTCWSRTCSPKPKRSRSAAPRRSRGGGGACRSGAAPHLSREPPSNVLLADELTPRALGALIAAYEHKVLTLGVLWDIDSFDSGVSSSARSWPAASSPRSTATPSLRCATTAPPTRCCGATGPDGAATEPAAGSQSGPPDLRLHSLLAHGPADQRDVARGERTPTCGSSRPTGRSPAWRSRPT